MGGGRGCHCGCPFRRSPTGGLWWHYLLCGGGTYYKPCYEGDEVAYFVVDTPNP